MADCLSKDMGWTHLCAEAWVQNTPEGKTVDKNRTGFSRPDVLLNPGFVIVCKLSRI